MQYLPRYNFEISALTLSRILSSAINEGSVFVSFRSLKFKNLTKINDNLWHGNELYCRAYDEPFLAADAYWLTFTSYALKKLSFYFSLLCLLCLPVRAQNQNLLIDSVVTYALDVLDSSFVEKEIFRYSPEGWLTYHGKYTWIRAERSWRTDSYTLHVYNDRGLDIQVDTYNWAVPFIYVEEYLHHEKTFDTDGNLRLDSVSRLNIKTNLWYPFLKYEYSIDDEGLVTFYLLSGWNSNQNDWHDPGKYAFSYNDNHKVTALIIFKWNANAQQWSSPDTTVSYRYDDQGRLIQKKYSSIDYDVPVDYLINYSYQGDSIMEVATFKKYSFDSLFSLIHYDRSVFRPDGLLLSVEQQAIDSENGEMSAKGKKIWTYSPEHNIVCITHCILARPDFWKPVQRSWYFYNMNSSNEIISHPDIALYPNPSSGIIYISGIDQPGYLKVFSPQGELLKSNTLPVNRIDLSNLPPGMYIILIQGKNRYPVIYRVILQ